VRRLAFLLAGLVLIAAGCGKGSSSGETGRLVVAVDVPVTGSPYVADTIRQGVELATSNLNGGGGVRVGSKSYLIKVKLYDNHLSARTAVENARRAIDAGAVAAGNVNPAQQILGVHATKERAVVENGQVVVRPMNYLALSYDHRIIDGREAVLFLVAIKEALEDPARLILEI